MSESIAAFMERRRREIERLSRKAVDAAHDAYAEANRAGRDLALKTQSQVMQYGARLAEATRPPAPTPRPAAGRSTSPLETPSARKAGGGVARLAGNALGLVEGAAHSAEGLIEGHGSHIGSLIRCSTP